jgi:beta-phosphoglucomutase
VLIEAKDWHYEALNKALNLFGFSINRFDHLVTYDGLPTRKKLEMLTLERGLPEQLHGFINEMKQIYTLETIHTKCKPVFYHEYALSKLKSAGFKLALASNSVRGTVELMMNKSELGKYMEFFLSAQDVVNAKPHPEIYSISIERLKLAPSECLILEDNANGIKAARASGAHVMVVSSIEDVTLDNILRNIDEAEKAS